jgi:hypothetical protein
MNSPVNTRVQVDGAKSQTHRFEKRGQIPDTFLKLLYTILLVFDLAVHDPDSQSWNFSPAIFVLTG